MRLSEPARTTRRTLLKRSALAAAAAAAAPYVITSSALGAGPRDAASGRLVMGVIGLGGRGSGVMPSFMANRDVQVVAVCDVFGAKRDRGKQAVDRHYGNQDCKTYIDLRELLARADIDAVYIATGDNWHSMASILAARAGKDMYCEKPLSVCVTDSRAVAQTMRRLGRVFQCGMQRRSVGHFIFAIQELVRAGKIGKLHTVYAQEAPWFANCTDAILPAESPPPREQFDWDLWLGPAHWRPYNKDYPSRGYWSGHWDFSGGSITEWGSHTVDLCHWGAGKDLDSPVEFHQEGRNYVGHYADGLKLVIRPEMGPGSCGARFEGDEGFVQTDDSGQILARPESLLQGRRLGRGYPVDDHIRNFLNCVKTRQQPVANADVAHYAITACHVANACKRLGRPVKWDPAKEEYIGDDEANRLRSRAYRLPWRLV